jgi:Leucine-rich repeat (LRR) protein
VDLLDLSSNFLMGEIPPTLGTLVMLQNLNFSHNNLTGQIPSSMGEMLSLSSIVLSYNQLKGPIPNQIFFRDAPLKWFIHNLGLCGTVQGLPPCGAITINKNDSTRPHKIKLIAILSSLGALFTLFILFGFYLKQLRRRKKMKNILVDSCRGDIFSVWNFDGRDAYEDIIRVTENFDEKYRIGIGGHGMVYKAILIPENIIVAVKKIQLADADTSLDTKSFHNEILTLTQIRHRNIVKLFGYCSSPQNKFLVYEYYERRDLHNILNNEVVSELDWLKRKAIVKDIACALSYMHHDCFPPIVHRDVTVGTVGVPTHSSFVFMISIVVCNYLYL